MFLLALTIAIRTCLAAPSAVPVIINNEVTNLPDNNFSWTGVNFDFWPTTKPKWEGAGALISDLTSPSLRALARGLSGSLLRLGGSPADFLLYDVSPDACSQANLNKTQPPPGGKGYFCPIWDQTVGQCLTLARWQALLTFAKDAGLSLVMDLNGCWGRKNATSDMDWGQIDGLLAVTAAAAGTWGGALWGVELSNEVYSNIAPAVYGAAVLRLRTKMDALWPASSPAPRIMGPDCWENDLSPTYYATMLAASKPSPSSPSSLHAITFHDYADDCCAPAAGNVLNVTCLDALFANAAWVRDLAAAQGVRVWNGEGALHSSSGVSGLTNTALSTLYYLHALGSYADNGFGLFSRQTLLGGDYGLTNRTTLQPTPDYWGLLAWRGLIGGGALGARVAAPAPGLRAHAFCARGAPGGVVALLVNFAAGEGLAAAIAWPGGAAPPPGAAGEMYQLTGVEGWEEGDGGGALGDAASNLFRLANNNVTLALVGGVELPTLAPVTVDAAGEVWLPPASATFVVWRGAGAAACM